MGVAACIVASNVNYSISIFGRAVAGRSFLLRVRGLTPKSTCLIWRIQPSFLSWKRAHPMNNPFYDPGQKPPRYSLLSSLPLPVSWIYLLWWYVRLYFILGATHSTNWNWMTARLVHRRRSRPASRLQNCQARIISTRACLQHNCECSHCHTVLCDQFLLEVGYSLVCVFLDR